MIDSSKFYSKSGHAKRALENCLTSFKCSNLNELKQKCDAKEIGIWEVSRLRGCGSVQVPGQLMQYLFGLPSREAKIKESVLNNLGAGI